MFKRVGVQLQPLRKLKTLKSERFYTFDCETKDGLKGKILYCYAFCEKHKNSFSQSFVKTDDLSFLFHRLHELKDKKRYTKIYVHNLDFDIRFIIKYCIDHHIEYHPIISGSSFVACIIESLRVKFIDTVQFLKCEQKEAEITYKIPQQYRKLECNEIFEKSFEKWSNEEKERVLEHNKLDVIALYHIVEKMRKELFEIAYVDFLNLLTPASLGMNAFRKFLTKNIKNPFVYQQFDSELNRIVYKYDKEKYEYVKKSYFGGRTEVFNTDYHQNITVYDRVSMYPAEMKFKKYPKGFGINYSNNEPDIIELNRMIQSEGIYAQYEGFIECIISFPDNIKYPLLAEHRNNKLMFTNCKKQSVFTLPELRYLYDKYQNEPNFHIQPLSGFIFYESEDYFSEYVDRMITAKQNSKDSKRSLAKLLMNSVYGKFGQAFERKEAKFHVFLTLNEALDFSDTLEENSFELKEKNNVFIVIEKFTSTSIKAFMNVCIASYITAYARINLTEQLHYFESKNIPVLYTDTDSYAIPSEYENDVNIGSELGNWDIEKQAIEIQYFAPKCYIYRDKNTNKFVLKLKGVEKRKIKEILHENKTFKDISNAIHETIHLNERYMKYKSAMRNCNILSSRQISKTYQFKNDKRIFNNHESIAYNDSNIHLLTISK